ncbi:hypothetical protein JXR93_10360 [bacterium]|nr:hypothetical protein [bacterium]
MRKILTPMIAIIISLPLWGGVSKWSLYGEVGFYHKGYDDRKYLDSFKTTFHSNISSLGTEYRYLRDDNMLIGGGFVETTIQSAEIKNYDIYETIPFTVITLPYIFIGKDFGFLSFELGVSWYLTFKDFSDLTHINEDGTESTQNGGFNWNRHESHVFPNFKLRLLEEDSFHIELKFGRGRFNPVDNLFNLALYFPLYGGFLGTEISMKTPKTNFYDEYDGMLRSNQKLSFSYSYDIDILSFELFAGYLLKNIHGGSGKISGFFYRFSGGFQLSLKW